ncbi:MAG: hypothetical protein K2J93_00665 [Anaeroplasmataceae bacterium]|nr:hypothetical protein [Anaeroplasmataceae bacterium]
MFENQSMTKYPTHTLGLANNEEIKYEIKKYLDNKTHSSAYIKVCAMELKRLGHMELSIALDKIAESKMQFEAVLMEAFGMKDDIRLNLNNVLMRAEEDVVFARKLELLAKDNNEHEVYTLMHELAKTEAENLAALMGIVGKVAEDDNRQRF